MSKQRMGYAGAVCFVVFLFQSSLPWTFPGDFRERLRMSDLVVAGTIEETSRLGPQLVDHATVTANFARLRVDRIFQGAAKEQLRFRWFTLYSASGALAYSGAPLASFQPHKRYLVFLKWEASHWVVAMPVYELEVELSSAPPPNSEHDLSRASLDARYAALTEELEAAAIAEPTPAPGTTGMATTYFAAVFDLGGACAEPFYRRFLTSTSIAVRFEAQRLIGLIHERRLTCKKRG